MRALLIFLVACAAADPGLRLAEPHAATADGVVRADVTFKGHDGLALYGQTWRPAVGEPRGVVVIHHGLADHSDRYAGFAERLVHAGYAVWSYDMRGHGRSAGARIAIPQIDDLLADLDGFLALVRAGEPNRPIIVYGHSLGGLAVALYAIERQPAVAGIVLAAPGIAFDTGPLAPAAVRFVAALAPDAPILDTPHRDFSKNPAVVAELDHDPLVHQAKGPAATARGSLDGVARVWAHPERLVAPLLIVHGRADKVTAPSGSRDLVIHAGTADRTLRLYDGMNHDILHDPGGDAVAADVVAWIDAHTGGPAVATPPLPSGPLIGDRSASTMAVEVGARGETLHDRYGSTGELRVRFGFGPYEGGLDLRAGYLTKAYYQADLHALGVGLRTGPASMALTGGIGFGGLAGASTIRIPVELSLELSVGPARLLARGGVAWANATYASKVGFADEARALLGLRLGRDVGYWSTVRAGTGPFVAATLEDLGGDKIVGVAIGGELWGAN